MLPELYRIHLSSQLNQAQLLTLEIIVWLLQVHKQVKIERLAAYFPLPIKYESRRRHIQRFLILPAMSVTLIWLPLIEEIIKLKFKKGERLYLAIDRTQWLDKNLFMIAVITEKRAVPIYWQFLDKKGASKLAEQQALIRPVLRLLKSYELVVLGDREFHSVELAKWLLSRKAYFVLRQKKDTYIQEKGKDYQKLDSLEIVPGVKKFLTGLKVRKEKGFSQGSIGIYWKRKYRGKLEEQPWYLLTNFSNLSEAIKAYQKRVGIEAMFKDCKSGGYNLEGSKASMERLTRLVLLIAIAYTFSSLKGQSIRWRGQQEYIGRVRKFKNVKTKNSHFWLGLYGDVWIISQTFIKDWVEQLIRLNPNKLPFYYRGLRAMYYIQQAF
ncbi:IS4 family transposase [Aphanothece hegewaldii CCALA 016]|uniref:IS4 family transposase n=1 Tax=Aphanothece hegewaldii CCALA 016 TaxID=2107694 RepID=A0A2T1LU29_9CHRO|nr:IS4 family transposase [Aphanothece hegewaldii]PSF34947.1 IS4 family transposase [Aphanothece hegewaldii CCALA 016]